MIVGAGGEYRYLPDPPIAMQDPDWKTAIEFTDITYR